ncbi:YjbF family lipoprotein [Erwinia amylovora]|uniref:YjbF family lipoprotein n=1 Tax=Erwinia amylovora TaxID=552 RepID=UPI000C06FFA1|nr:YjbF family lipoprotein [Erwinia amylovora]UDJ86486.1 YjbF family lipoprotein [Erwinia amylovora]UDJ97944.1 YjbF family lipoprotein [Erwinia amylovora]UDK89994.1 YjbF family lipoprotein [Erwinia amylovora]UDK93390.1 YjbF family lipoprotein [Erwinia amylovora]UOD74222.1 YjbF family lipoprotein [Erwinia amylovora]
MRNLPLLLLCLLLQACSQTQKGLDESLRLALFGADDIRMTNGQINNLPYASMYLRVNGGQQIFVVLGYNENGQQKWITRDKAMLAMEHGRLVKTVGLADNLNEVSNLQRDPLRDALHLSEGASWSRIVSWTVNGKSRAATVTSRFIQGQDEVLQLAGQPVACRVWYEEVALAENGASWRNTFWVDASSGQVRQSQQTLGTDALSIEATILKPATS